MSDERIRDDGQTEIALNLLKTYPDEVLPLKRLKAHGTRAVRSARRLSQDLCQWLQKDLTDLS